MKSGRPLLLAALVASLAAFSSQAGATAPRAHLRAFPSCSNFVHYARAHAPSELRTRGIPELPALPQTTTHPLENGTAAPESAPAPASGGAGQDFSTTNNQEAGVDEPDQVKTDGKTIFVAENGRLYAIDARSPQPKLLDSIPLQGFGQQLLLSGDRLLVMAGAPIVYALGGPTPVSVAPRGARASLVPAIPNQASTVQLVDVSDPSALKVLKTMSVNGGYLTARMTGHTARVIFSATPRVLPVLQSAAPGMNSPKIARTTTPDWRPSYALRRGVRGRVARHALVRCTAINQPAQFSGLNSLTVLTIDVDKGLDPVDSDAIMTDGQTVYASKDSLYVATQKAAVEQPDATQPPPLGQTEIHRFDISQPDTTTYEGSGVVDGSLLNQYSMSEQGSYLRVASTSAPLWWSPDNNVPSQSFVTVLEQDGGSLRPVGRVGNLGSGERIYAVRFIGDVGYVVTFRQIDPLYTVGLGDPANPKVLGSVDLLGYSAYLHPVGPGLLLGVGQAASDQGRTQGTQISLFEVADPAHPSRIANALVGSGSSSSAEFDPHAFLWWDPLKLAVLPVTIYNYQTAPPPSPSPPEPSSTATVAPGDQFTGAIGFSATRDGVTEVGRLSHPAGPYGYAAPIDRSLVVGGTLFTVASNGVMASDLKTFAQTGFVDLPMPQPIAGSGTGSAGSGTVSSPPATT